MNFKAVIKMRFLLLLAFLLDAEIAYSFSYEGYKVYHVLPANEMEIQLLKQFSDSRDYDFWSSIRQGASYVDIMINPKSQPSFTNFLQKAGIDYRVIFEDVESTIQSQLLESKKAPQLGEGKISFDKYYPYDEIRDYLRALAVKYPHASLEKIGLSYEGRDLNVIKISSNPTAKKPIIFIDGGIHAREWISPATVLYIVYQLVENPKMYHLLDKVDWHIIPTLNPDGYSYTFTTSRMWRKTRSPNDGHSCAGTDPNRNFGFHWGGPGSQTYPCAEAYKGKTPFSEPETSALRDYILKCKDSVKLYLSFHSYGCYLLYPWSYTSESPENAKELNNLGKSVAEGIRQHAGTNYVVGGSTGTLGPTAGSSDDWVMGEAGVKLAYTVELPGKGKGFLLPPHEILPVVEETWMGMLKFHEYIATKYGNA